MWAVKNFNRQEGLTDDASRPQGRRTHNATRRHVYIHLFRAVWHLTGSRLSVCVVRGSVRVRERDEACEMNVWRERHHFSVVALLSGLLCGMSCCVSVDWDAACCVRACEFMLLFTLCLLCSPCTHKFPKDLPLQKKVTRGSKSEDVPCNWICRSYRRQMSARSYRRRRWGYPGLDCRTPI